MARKRSPVKTSKRKKADTTSDCSDETSSSHVPIESPQNGDEEGTEESEGPGPVANARTEDQESSIVTQDENDEAQRNIKRMRYDIVPVEAKVITVKKANDRTSDLLSPTMLLSGHAGTVYSMKFDPTGQHIVSGSFDRKIYLWNVYGDCENYNVIEGHKNAVLDVHWTYDSTQIISASADKTIGLWDATTSQRIKKFMGHSSVVNSCGSVRSGPTFIVSGSNDGTTKIWDARLKLPVQTLVSDFAITATCFGPDVSTCISGGLDGRISMWDLRKNSIVHELEGHSDIITSLSLSPGGTHVLSNAMDHAIRKWDIRPWVTGNRCQNIYYGAKHGPERNLQRCGWSPSGHQIISGSADRQVYIWDADSAQLVYQLPGHQGCVNEAVFHPKEPIIGSCGSDKLIYIGELTS